MKLEELVLAICVRTEAWGSGETDLILGNYYVIDEINIGQSHSTVKINGKSYNSIMFDYYETKPLNIYEKYSPYRMKK